MRNVGRERGWIREKLESEGWCRADGREIGGVTWWLGLSIVKRKSECKMVGFGMISALKVIIML